MGFCADTCSVMFGRKKSVSTILQETIPSIANIKCSCHSIHLVASNASKKLPELLEHLMRSIFAHFSRSTSRRRKLVAFQQFVKIEEHVMISPGQTRWLSLEYCVLRVLEQFDALKLYFEKEDRDEKTKTTTEILHYLNERSTKPLLLFMKYALNHFNEFNTVFQSEMPKLHLLQKEVCEMLTSLAINFMVVRYVRSVDPFNINPDLTNQYLPIDKVYCGNYIISEFELTNCS